MVVIRPYVNCFEMKNASIENKIKKILTGRRKNIICIIKPTERRVGIQWKNVIWGDPLIYSDEACRIKERPRGGDSAGRNGCNIIERHNEIL